MAVKLPGNSPVWTALQALHHYLGESEEKLKGPLERNFTFQFVRCDIRLLPTHKFTVPGITELQSLKASQGRGGGNGFCDR